MTRPRKFATPVIGGELQRATGVAGVLKGREREEDLSFLDGTCVTDISESGDELLFSEAWKGGGSDSSRPPRTPRPARAA